LQNHAKINEVAGQQGAQARMAETEASSMEDIDEELRQAIMLSLQEELPLQNHAKISEEADQQGAQARMAEEAEASSMEDSDEELHQAMLLSLQKEPPSQNHAKISEEANQQGGQTRMAEEALQRHQSDNLERSCQGAQNEDHETANALKAEIDNLHQQAHAARGKDVGAAKDKTNAQQAHVVGEETLKSAEDHTKEQRGTSSTSICWSCCSTM